MAFRASQPPSGANVQELARWMEGELARLTLELPRPDFLAMKVLTVEPVRLFTGLVAYADGTSWNPGSGEGLYEYRSDAAWHKL
jgi:hypothetical protein